MNLNRNKRSLAVNMKSPEGVALMKELAKQADALVENIRPGIMEIGRASCRERV